MKFSLVLAVNLVASGLVYGADSPAPAAAAPQAAPAAEAPAATAPAAAAATEGAAGPQEAVCKSGANTRRVKLDVSADKCLVIYVKETEKPGTEGDKLWEYNHEIDKCKKSYSDFVEKLRGMSWSCS